MNTNKAHVFRVYCEGGNGLTGKVLDEANKRFDCYTVLTGTGYWRGIGETCLILEFVQSHNEIAKVQELAHAIRVTCDQSAVLITSALVDADLVVSAGNGQSTVTEVE